MSKILALIEQNNIETEDRQTLMEKFNDYEQIAQEWEAKARTIVVTSATQTTEMAMAKEARKKFSAMRIEIEKTRKALKEQSLRKGQAIDAIAKYLTSLVSPIEAYLLQQEDFVKIQEEKERERLRVEAEQKAAEERAVREKAEAEERDRLRLENERLRQEAAEREEQVRKERQERERLENEARLREEEEARKLRLQEEMAKKEQADRERVERDKKYTDWLQTNAFDATNMKVVSHGSRYEMWKLVSTLEV